MSIPCQAKGNVTLVPSGVQRRESAARWNHACGGRTMLSEQQRITHRQLIWQHCLPSIYHSDDKVRTDVANKSCGTNVLVRDSLLENRDRASQADMNGRIRGCVDFNTQVAVRLRKVRNVL